MTYLPGGDLLLVAGLVDDLRDVVADGLRQAGRVHGDHVGLVDGEDVLDRLEQVGLAAEDARSPR